MFKDATDYDMSNASLAKKCMSSETRAKLSAALKGREVSAETRAKLSAALKGREVSAETLAKISAALKGKEVSAKTRAKLSAAQPNKKPCKTPLGLFETSAAAAVAHNISLHTLNARLHSKSAKFADWYRVED